VSTLPKVKIKKITLVVTRANVTESENQEGQRFKIATARWQGAAWHEAQASADQGRNPKMTTATSKRESTQILKLLTFSGNRETKEDRRGTKHIGATDILK
jgi:hypothetical protein